MKNAKYYKLDGSSFEVAYDENQPCICCGLPVLSASMGGTVVCSWCDCGHLRVNNNNNINPFDKYSVIQSMIDKYWEYYIEFNEVAKKYPYIKEHFDVNRVIEIAKNYKKIIFIQKN